MGNVDSRTSSWRFDCCVQAATRRLPRCKLRRLIANASRSRLRLHSVAEQQVAHNFRAPRAGDRWQSSARSEASSRGRICACRSYDGYDSFGGHRRFRPPAAITPQQRNIAGRAVRLAPWAVGPSAASEARGPPQPRVPGPRSLCIPPHRRARTDSDGPPARSHFTRHRWLHLISVRLHG
jgi:hypothetical protein